jgi:nitric oxide reductase subunit B
MRRVARPKMSPFQPDIDPLGRWEATPSQRATVKYFWVVSALILLQMLLGVIVAHYGVEGDGFYGFPLSKWLPYSVARTWHVQLGLFWIATAWLAAGSIHRATGQRAGTDGAASGSQCVVPRALLLVVGGSLTGRMAEHSQSDVGCRCRSTWAIRVTSMSTWGESGKSPCSWDCYCGFFLMIRVLLPALRRGGEQKQLVALLTVSTGAIALFYGAGLTWGRHTNLSMVEYWRWWVIHLWVEGFFEVFATTIIAFIFMRLNLIRPGIAAAAALLSATIFLSGGIIGTCHHLYFTGTPPLALAWGSVFSALEVVPLVLVGFDAMEDLRRSRTSPWVQRYKWPIYFFVAVAFWNMVGAGLFGFMINPPIALYYMQGLNTTPLHGHAALFGVYGMLGIGLMLVCLRVLVPGVEWKDGLLRFSFWSLNLGLMTMCVLSLLPVGLMQTWASVEHGYWYARSSEFLQTPLMQNLRWMRVPGDTIFFLGAVTLVMFVAGLKTGHSFASLRNNSKNRRFFSFKKKETAIKMIPVSFKPES